MKFKISTQGLLDGVGPVVSASKFSDESPTSGCISIKATPECLYVIAAGSRLSVKNPVPYMAGYCTEYKFEKAGDVTVKADDILAILESFPSKEILLVELIDGKNGSELSIHPQSDTEQIQTVPVRPEKIEPHPDCDSYEMSVGLNRELFVRALSLTLKCGGYEESVTKYLYWMFRSSPGRLRFVSGTGAIFAMYSVTGQKFEDNKTFDFPIPVEPSHILLKLLEGSTAENVTIRLNVVPRKNTKQDTPKQYVVECGDTKVVITGYNPPCQWVDEDEHLTRTNKYRAIVNVDEWKLAFKGITATYTSEEEKLLKKDDRRHATTITLDCEKKHGQLQSTGTMKALRKVSLSDIECSGGTSVFRCCTEHLITMFSDVDHSEYVQMELSDEESKSMVVRFYASPKLLSKGSIFRKCGMIDGAEEFVMFVARTNKS